MTQARARGTCRTQALDLPDVQDLPAKRPRESQTYDERLARWELLTMRAYRGDQLTKEEWKIVTDGKPGRDAPDG